MKFHSMNEYILTNIVVVVVVFFGGLTVYIYIYENNDMLTITKTFDIFRGGILNFRFWCA